MDLLAGVADIDRQPVLDLGVNVLIALGEVELALLVEPGDLANPL